jgi:pimeloyl-ACP methyl ester carboxylesterase
MPSLPGFGFSDKPSAPGCGVRRIAQTWADLMRRLGYDRYVAAGSDWGTSVSATLAELDSAHVVGAHLMPPLAAPDPSTFDTLTDAERASLESMEQRASHESAYSEIHRTRPQTIGYGLLDSPVLLCAWILEKWSTWTDGPLDVERSIGLDPVLDHVSWYWFTRTGASAARLYSESIADVSRWLTEPGVDVIDAPVGCSVFAGEVPRPSRRWAEKRFRDIRYWAEHDRGGHFAAVEVPELVVGDLRASFRELR